MIHPDQLYQLAVDRHRELIAEAQRFADQEPRTRPPGRARSAVRRLVRRRSSIFVPSAAPSAGSIEMLGLQAETLAEAGVAAGTGDRFRPTTTMATLRRSSRCSSSGLTLDVDTIRAAAAHR